MSESWRAKAACRERTAMMFDNARQGAARSLCDGCPVEQVCLWATLRDETPNDRYGMVGGMSSGERAALAGLLSPTVIGVAYNGAVAAWEVRSGLRSGAGSEPLTSSVPGTPEPVPINESTEADGTDSIIASTAAAFGLRTEQLYGRSRTARLVEARQVAMYVLREGGGLSYPAIGAALGGRDHTTAMHAVARVRARMAEAPALRRGVEALLANVASGCPATVTLHCEMDTGDAGASLLLEEVAQVCGVRVEQLCGRSRIRHLVEARHIAMYVLRETGLSYPAIGAALGGRDHTTAMYAVQRVGNAIMRPGPIRDRVDQVMAMAVTPAAKAA